MLCNCIRVVLNNGDVGFLLGHAGSALIPAQDAIFRPPKRGVQSQNTCRSATGTGSAIVPPCSSTMPFTKASPNWHRVCPQRTVRAGTFQTPLLLVGLNTRALVFDRQATAPRLSRHTQQHCRPGRGIFESVRQQVHQHHPEQHRVAMQRSKRSACTCCCTVCLWTAGRRSPRPT